MVQLKVMAQAKNNRNLLMHFKGYEDFVSRILDLEEKSKRYRSTVYTPFLNEKEREIVHQVIHNAYLYEDGGYLDSERKKMAISFYDEEVEIPLVCLSDKFDRKYHTIEHRDVLGTLLHLGIDRNVIGDIIVDENRIYLFVEKDMENYLVQHVTKISRCPITLQKYDEYVSREIQLDYKQHIVSSFRLDVLVASICQISREKAKLLIKGGKVKVNQVVLEDYDYLCNNNSTISIRGYGRFVFLKQIKKTKKDRYVVEIGKYI